MASDKVLTAIGLMAGTSLDAVDAAVLRTDGEWVLEPGPSISVPYSRVAKAEIRRATRAALEGRNEAADIARAADEVTSAHIHAVRELLDQADLARDDVDVIGFHGQTILHRPPSDGVSVGRSWQIGSGRTLADELRIDVVDGFRQADIAAGGEGAPLAPIYHAALVKQLERPHAVGVLNLGGVANITFVPANGASAGLVAFDCGPGNGLVDEWVQMRTGESMDRDGALAADGTVDEQTVRLMSLAPYLRRPAPKSLDRYDFKLKPVEGMSVPDGAATLTAFTAACVARSVPLLPSPPGEWIVCGGGRHNPVLMQELQDRLTADVLTAEEAGWRGDDVEAECFAYLAVRSLKKLPISFQKTTGAPRPLTGGVYNRKPV
ncbi:anhydro-N-acetylmuramic acid kinase [Parvularcula dongshanensis]|uniref:Anhydro-N-acetylmuramic acid kinase n=1 Tax=Parvularcula dongshanensis TaxID=1173995 RepID=A0A840I4R0_9PROT|nr:anhydro-N-acetylmuramic acid kinase [Parvularcula dongshanensis]MBB4659829.1 anhydro-N-acetylmuramic acid kinase [Parvularcula dongshanensis]